MRICDAFFAFPIVAGVALFAQASILLTISTQNQRSVLMTAANKNPTFFHNITIAAADKVPNFFQNLFINADPIFIALILFSWMGYTRIIHSQVLQSIKEEYIKAARACGAQTSG
jgi:ABC-type dipeptide/oligopeptide/nickel transport system permease subunit